MDNNSAFSYTYSAPQNQEVLAIRQKYLPQEENKLEELKRLDRNVQQSGIPEALCLGILGCLVFGIGLCICLGVIGGSHILGVIIGALGTAIMLPAYPVYRLRSDKAKARLSPRILELADELAGGNS